MSNTGQGRRRLNARAALRAAGQDRQVAAAAPASISPLTVSRPAAGGSSEQSGSRKSKAMAGAYSSTYSKLQAQGQLLHPSLQLGDADLSALPADTIMNGKERDCLRLYLTCTASILTMWALHMSSDAGNDTVDGAGNAVSNYAHNEMMYTMMYTTCRQQHRRRHNDAGNNVGKQSWRSGRQSLVLPQCIQTPVALLPADAQRMGMNEPQQALVLHPGGLLAERPQAGLGDPSATQPGVLRGPPVALQGKKLQLGKRVS